MNSPLPTAVVLCGGLGTRVRLAAPGLQKTMIPVGGRPFLERVVRWASGQGCRRFVFATGHLGDQVRDYFASAPGYEGHELLFSREESPLGTGGALDLCRGLLGGAAALVLNGDSICPIELRAFLSFHVSRRGVASLVAAPAEGRSDGGFIRADADGRVLSFAEKEPGAGRGLNAGIYLLEPGFRDLIPRGRPSSLEHEVFPLALKRGVYAYAVPASVQDIGAPERLSRLAGPAPIRERGPAKNG